MQWCRLYHEFATDPKVQMMPEAMQRRLCMLFCFQSDGSLEEMDDEMLAFALRIDASEVKKTKELFIKKGFIGKDSWRLLNWDKRQRPSDNVNERVKRYRERNGSVSNDSVTFQKRKMSGGGNVAGNVSPSTLLSSNLLWSESGGSPEGTEPARTYSADETRVANLAIELGCDFSWGTWAGWQFTLGISPAVLEAALHEAVNCGKVSQPYVGKIAARFKRDGIPKASFGKGKPSREPLGGTNGSDNTTTPSQRLKDEAKKPPTAAEKAQWGKDLAALKAKRKKDDFDRAKIEALEEDLAR
jgi:hypothetical protein